MSLAELKERVSKATGPDREIDAMMCVALHVTDDPNWIPPATNVWQYDRFGGVGVYPPEGKRLGQPGYTDDQLVGSFRAPAYTASLDAAVALVEKMLPGWSYGFAMRGDKLRREGCDDERAYAWLKNGDQADADAPTLPLAILSALLEALAETTDQSKEYVK